MKRNQLIFIKELSLDELPVDSIRIVLDGDKMKTENEFLDEIGTAFSFPTPCEDNVDGFLDWMGDLNWEPFEKCKKIVLVIKNQKQFLSTNPQERQCMLDFFIEDILQYWEKDVVHCMVGGECKEFNIYLVNDVK